MKLSDRIKRWWKPAEWRDEHPEISSGEGFALGHEEQRRQTVVKPRAFQGSSVSDNRKLGRYRR